MSKALAIVALILSILCIFIPLYGPWLSIVSAGLAAFAAGPGFGIGLAAVILNIIDVLFLSPSIYLQGAGRASSTGNGGAVSLAVIIVLVQIAAGAFLFVRNRKMHSTYDRPK